MTSPLCIFSSMCVCVWSSPNIHSNGLHSGKIKIKSQNDVGELKYNLFICSEARSVNTVCVYTCSGLLFIEGALRLFGHSSTLLDR